ncbi:hypothetical protein COCOBI_18-2840 [Coccomyxa sp. Obi]|nr:hypothetical protein COCOBI_18-2840 [Coccomyxa sp. Obi]
MFRFFTTSHWSSADLAHHNVQSTPCSKLCMGDLREQKLSRLNDYPEHTFAHQTECTATSSPCGEACSMSEGTDQLSPESVQVRVEEPRRSCPKGSTAAAFHGVSQEALTYYEKLIVIHHNSSSSLHFNLRQRSHCALVYYEDAKSDEHELAYADLLYCYSLDGDVYIEHGYLFDTEDLYQHPMGRLFLKSCQLSNNELVDSPGIYHSLATVIEVQANFG